MQICVHKHFNVFNVWMYFQWISGIFTLAMFCNSRSFFTRRYLYSKVFKMYDIVNSRLPANLNTTSCRVKLPRDLDMVLSFMGFLLAPCYTLLPRIKEIDLVGFVQFCLQSDKSTNRQTNLTENLDR